MFAFDVHVQSKIQHWSDYVRFYEIIKAISYSGIESVHLAKETK